MSEPNQLTRQPGAPEWKPNTEYAVWFKDGSSHTIRVDETYARRFGGGDPFRLAASDILWHVELPPKPPRLKPGLYYAKHEVAGSAHLVALPTGVVQLFGGLTLSTDFALPSGYEIVEFYQAGWEDEP